MEAAEVASVERWITHKQRDIAAARAHRSATGSSGARQRLPRPPAPQMLRALEAYCARRAAAAGDGAAVILECVVVSTPSRSADDSSLLEVKLRPSGVVAQVAPPRGAALTRLAAKARVGNVLRVRLRSVDAKEGRVVVDLV
jgi:hypothetical protein